MRRKPLGPRSSASSRPIQTTRMQLRSELQARGTARGSEIDTEARGLAGEACAENLLAPDQAPHLARSRQRGCSSDLSCKRVAQREVLKSIQKREAWLAKHAPKTSWPPIKRLISPDPDNADAALLLLGIAAPNPSRMDIDANRAQLLLEPWAVQAALHRRRGGSRLTGEDRAAIRRCTRDPDSLSWPRGT